MQTDYATFLHTNPPQPSQSTTLELDQDEQADSSGDPNEDLGINGDDAQDDEDEEDQDGFALKEPNPPVAAQAQLPTHQELPADGFYDANPTAHFPYPMMDLPVYFAPPQHNPYSPSSGGGHLHPPIISRAPYFAFPLPPPPPPTAPVESATIVNGNDTVTPSVPLEPSPEPSQETSPLPLPNDAGEPEIPESESAETRPSKRQRKSNAILSSDAQDKSTDELYTELPAPAPIDDPDPTAPPNSTPGRVAYAKFKCLLCDATFPRRNAVVAHIKTHMGKRKFPCKWPGCPAAFVREHDCRRHEGTHTNSRPHVCGCGRPFGRPDALRRHQEKGSCGRSGLVNLPHNVAPSVGSAARQAELPAPMAFTAEQVATLTRQLNEATAAVAAAHINPALGPQSSGAVLSIVPPEPPKPKKVPKQRKRISQKRNLKGVKSPEMITDEDPPPLNVIDPTLTSTRPTGTPLDPSTPNASMSNLVHLPFLPYINPLDSPNGPFNQSAGAFTSNGFISSPYSTPYHPQTFKLRAVDPVIASLDENDEGEQPSFYLTQVGEPGPSGSGNKFVHTTPQEPSPGDAQSAGSTSGNRVGSVGPSLLEIAVDAATRAHERRNAEQSRRAAEKTVDEVSQPQPMDIDMGMDLLHSGDVDVEEATAPEDDDDVDGTDVGARSTSRASGTALPVDLGNIIHHPESSQLAND